MSLTQQMATGEALARLAIARGAMLDDVTSEVYLDGLQDVDPDLVSRACRDLARLERREYDTALPSVGTIRERCRQLESEDASALAASRLLPLPKSDEDGPRVFCRDCQDESSGFRVQVCRGVGDLRVLEIPDRLADLGCAPCGRMQRHGIHTFAERCHCFDTNPVIARRRDAQRQRKAS